MIWKDFGRALRKPTCEASQRQLNDPLGDVQVLGGNVVVVVGQNGQCVIVLVEGMTPDDAQILQGDDFHLVEGDQHVAAHFLDALPKQEVKWRGIIPMCS